MRWNFLNIPKGAQRIMNQSEEDRAKLVTETATRGLHMGHVAEVKKMLADNPYTGTNILEKGWRIVLKGQICLEEKQYALAQFFLEQGKEIYEQHAKADRDANINTAVIYIQLSDTHRRLSESVDRNHHLNKALFYAKQAMDKFNSIEEMNVQYLIAGKRFVDIEIEMSTIQRNIEMLQIDLDLLQQYYALAKEYTDWDVHNTFMYGIIISISYVLCLFGRFEESITYLKPLKSVRIVPGFDDDRFEKILKMLYHSPNKVQNDYHRELWQK